MGDPARWALSTVAAVLVLAACPDACPQPVGCAPPPFPEQSAIVAILVAASLSDVRTRTVPDASSLGIIACHAASMAFLAAFEDVPAGWLVGRSLLGSAAIGGGTLLLVLAFEGATGRAALGGGDVKLLFALGFALGWERGLLALLAACAFFVFAVGAAGVARRVRRRAPAPGSGGGAPCAVPDAAYPFVPALAAGIYVILLCF